MSAQTVVQEAAAEPRLHRVTWTIGTYEVCGTFHCDGDSTSTCHQTRDCVHVADEGECACPLVPSDECWAAAWLGSGDPLQDSFTGPSGTPLRDGQVDVTWSADFEGPAWEYLGPIWFVVRCAACGTGSIGCYEFRDHAERLVESHTIFAHRPYVAVTS